MANVIHHGDVVSRGVDLDEFGMAPKLLRSAEMGLDFRRIIYDHLISYHQNHQHHKKHQQRHVLFVSLLMFVVSSLTNQLPIFAPGPFWNESDLGLWPAELSWFNPRF